MATFITKIKFSQQGIKDIDHTTKRAAAIKTAAKKMSVKVKEVYWTPGDHDGVLIFEPLIARRRRRCFCTFRNDETSIRQLAGPSPPPRWTTFWRRCI